MLLKDAFQAAMDEWEWEDSIDHDESDDTYIMRTRYYIEGQSYSFVILTDEDRKWITISVKSPVIIPEARRADAAVLLNYFNCGIRIGKLCVHEDDGTVYYENTMDIEGTEPAPMLFSNMRDRAGSAFDESRCNAIGALSFTKQKLRSIIEEYEESLKSDGDETPDEI